MTLITVQIVENVYENNSEVFAGVDLGFHMGGGANPPVGGHQHTNLSDFLLTPCY